MTRQTRRRRLALSLFGAAVVLTVTAALLLPLLSGGQAGWGLSRHWRVVTWSERQLEWDNTLPGQPLLPQIYQVRTEQFGPIVMVTRRRVPPRPGTQHTWEAETMQGRVHVGMTRTQVHALLGQPVADDTSPPPPPRYDNSTPVYYERETFFGRDGTLYVVYRDSRLPDKVVFGVSKEPDTFGVFD